MRLEREIADPNGNGRRGETCVHLYLKDRHTRARRHSACGPTPFAWLREGRAN